MKELTLTLLDGRRTLALFPLSPEEYAHLDLESDIPAPLPVILPRLQAALTAGHARLRYAQQALKSALNAPISGQLQATVTCTTAPPPAPAEKLSGCLHISQFPTGPKPRRACVVGKGPSMMEWKNVPDVDVFFTLNEATYAVDRLHFHCRGDGHVPGARAMDWLPSYAVPFVPERIRHYYGYGWWFHWEDIGSEGICLTAIEAVRLAHWMGAQEIIFCGMDALRTGDTSHVSWVASERNLRYGMRDQRDRFLALPEEITAKIRHFDGSPMVSV
jgi:hypothetical protein